MPLPEFGSQTPRFGYAPPSASNASGEVIDLMDELGQPLDPWQGNTLKLWLGERTDGKWAALEAALIVARQNGKGGAIEGRELGSLMLFGDALVMHTAHRMDTSKEAFRRMDDLLGARPWMSRRVLRVSHVNGDEGFDFTNGSRIRYRTRGDANGRGFSGDCVVLDEAQALKARQLAALMPTLTARPNPQLIYAGTVDGSAFVLKRIVERGRKGGARRLAYAEWSEPDGADQFELAGRALSNPAIGYRIDWDYLEAELDSFTDDRQHESPEYAAERMSIWPDVSKSGLIDTAAWEACEDQNVGIPAKAELFAGVAVSADRKWASVVIGWQADGVIFVDLAKRQRGTAWVVPFLADVNGRRRIKRTVVDQGGPAATLLPALGAAGLNIRVIGTAEMKVSAAGLVDDVRDRKVRHRGQLELTEAAYAVKEHRVTDGFVFARRDSGIPIDPLEAAQLARFGNLPDPKAPKEFFMYDPDGQQ